MTVLVTTGSVGVAVESSSSIGMMDMTVEVETEAGGVSVVVMVTVVVVTCGRFVLVELLPSPSLPSIGMIMMVDASRGSSEGLSGKDAEKPERASINSFERMMAGFSAVGGRQCCQVVRATKSGGCKLRSFAGEE